MLATVYDINALNRFSQKIQSNIMNLCAVLFLSIYKCKLIDKHTCRVDSILTVDWLAPRVYIDLQDSNNHQQISVFFQHM